MINDIVASISTSVESQFPAFYREDGPAFVSFVKAYYQWLEQSDQALGKSRNLFNTRDIDSTSVDFIEHFKKKYFADIPTAIQGDRKFLQKHILDIYRSKGSEEGVKLLFRLLFNEDVKVYIPSQDILKASDGIWVEPKYFEISNNPLNYLYQQKYVTGSTSGATAFVDNYKRVFIDDKIVHTLFITNISGTFSVGEQLICEGVSIDDAAYILGSPENFTINFATPAQPVGDVFQSDYVDGRSRISGFVAETYNVTDGFINFVLKSGGTKVSALANISITTGSNTTGHDAGFTGFILANTENFTYNTNVMNYRPHDKTKYFNPNKHVKTSSDFIEFANNTFFANGDMVQYTCAPGNTEVSGLSNGSYYYVASTNTSGLKLTTSYSYKTFNANSAVNATSEFITISSNPFSNGTAVRYMVSAGNTALTNLANNSYYYAIQANSSGLKLATSYDPTIFNPALAVNTEIDDYFIQISNNVIANDEIVRYVTAYGNTAIAALANNTYYYVVQANTLGIKLSSTLGGSAILLYSTSLPSEDGHYIYRPGTPINLTKGLTQTGHALLGAASFIDLTSGLNEFGHSLTNRGVSIDANAGVNSTSEFITSANNLFANGHRVTYHAINGNTALTNLTNNTIYWIVSANDSGFKLSSTYGGSAIDLTSGNTETGHFFTGVSLIDTVLNVDSYGFSLNNANVASVINTALTDSIMTVGTIRRLTGINPGKNYDGDVVVRIRDNYTASYGLFDANGNIEGQNANVTGKAIRGQGIPLSVKIRDSGFGYNTQDEGIVVYNSADADKNIDANIVLGPIGVSPGYWKNDQGKISDFPKIHDNYYYQEYSYEVQSNKTLDKYFDVLKKVVHPAGNRAFGKPVLVSKQTVPILVVNSYVTQA